MVKLSIGSLAIFTSLLAASAVAKDVVCLVNESPVATVDLDTGVCPFKLPSELLAFFNYDAADDYNIQFYYAIANNARFFTDIVNAGTQIDIPANLIYGTDGAPVYQVHVQDSPSSNSTEAIRKRMMNKVDIIKRDAASDFAESLKGTDGTLVNSGLFKVVDVDSVSSSSGAPTSVPVSSGVETVPPVTETFESTKIITVTHCSENKCSETTVPATPTVTTCTTEGTVTTFTTYCPIETETNTHTDIVTVTHCSDNKCSETTVPATPTLTTETIGGSVTIYTTYCPISEITGTEAPGTKAPGTEAPGTKAPGTKAPGTEAPGTKAPGTKAPGTEAPGTKAPGTEAPGTTVAGETNTEAPGTTVAGETNTAAPGTTVAGETNTAAPGTTVAGETNNPTVAAPSVAPSSTASVITYSESSGVIKGTSLFALLLVSLVHLF